MKTISDVIRAVSHLVEEVFGAPPITKDIVENKDRPCTYVEPTGVTTAVKGCLRHDTYDIEIIRFGELSYRGYRELLGYQEQLTEILESPIKLDEEFFVYPEDVDFDISRDEMYLQTSFTVQLYQVPEDPYAEVMEELELTGGDTTS